MTRMKPLPAMQWRSMDSAPRDGAWVLVRGGTIDYGWDGDTEPPAVVAQWVGSWQFAWFDSGYYGEYINPTHWTPLPSPEDQT